MEINPTKTHCQNCGSHDYRDGEDGYTACCNENVCYGDTRLWQTNLGPIRACCAAVLDAQNPGVTESWR